MLLFSLTLVQYSDKNSKFGTVIYASLSSVLRYCLSFLEGIRENLKWKVPLNAHSSKPSAFRFISVEMQENVSRSELVLKWQILVQKK